MISKIETLRKIQEEGIIAVIRNVPEERLEELAQTLISSGITLLEITVDGENAYSVIETLSKKFKGQAVIGAGTVLDGPAAQLAISKGAEFVLSPSYNPEVVKTALRYGKVVIPGVMTPSEMVQAIECGADMVKVFPSSVLGVKFIKDVKGPLSHIPMVSTGGINENNAADFIKAGVEAVGVGGSLLNREAIENGDFEWIREKASQYVTSVRDAKHR
jgi:2-dehydro-3-deoxyphosphogluconate aldolase / (4S)-4-hydroxy-2-oxoglutarate aldolase